MVPEIWVHERWMDRWKDRQTVGQMDRQRTDGQINVQTEGWMDGQTEK